MALVLVTPPDADPAPLAEVKDILRVEYTDADARLDRHIRSAVDYIERTCDVKLAPQQWRWTVSANEISGTALRLPLQPVQSVDEITVGEATSTDGFSVSGLGSEQGSSVSWEDATASWAAGTTVLFTVGYEILPDGLFAAITFIVGVLFDGGDLEKHGSLNAVMSRYRLMHA